MEFESPEEFGLQFTVSFADHYTVPDLVELAALARRKGFSRIWVNDNLGYRNVFTVLSAVASEVPIGLGTGIAVPYYRNPVDFADTLASITELRPDRELSVGIGRGSLAQTGVEIETPAPYRVLAETASLAGDLLAGEEVRFGEFEALTEVFGLRPDARMHLRFEPRAPVRFYLGGYGPTALRTGGRYTDGMLFGGWFLPLLKAGKLDDLVARAREAAREVDPGKDLRILAELNVAVAEDAEDALEFGRRYGAHAMLTLRRQLADGDLREMGIDPAALADLERAFEEGATIQEAARLVTEPMVRALFVAGDAEGCVRQLRRLRDRYDPPVDRLVFAKLGPDYERAIRTLADDVLPAL